MRCSLYPPSMLRSVTLGRASESREKCFSLRQMATYQPSQQLQGPHNLSFNARSHQAEAECTSWFSKGGSGSLQKVKLLKVSEQGKSQEWLLFSNGKTWSTTSQSRTYLEGRKHSGVTAHEDKPDTGRAMPDSGLHFRLGKSILPQPQGAVSYSA